MGNLSNLLLLLLLLYTIATVQSRLAIFLTDAPIQRIGPRLYKKELLTNSFLDPVELAYDSSTRNLFFMYMDNALQNSGRAYINVVTRVAKKIEGIRENKATAVDSEAGTVYFGSRDGLYTYDPITNSAKNIGLYNVNVYKLVIRYNQMYLIDANDHMIYVVKDGNRVVRYGNARTVIDFDIDGSGNVHFVTMCGVFCAIGGSEVVKNGDLTVAYNFIIDGERTFAMSDGALYEIKCHNGTATKVSDLNFRPRSLVFGDYGDLYYSEDDNIYRLRPITSYVIYNLKPKPKKALKDLV